MRAITVSAWVNSYGSTGKSQGIVSKLSDLRPYWGLWAYSDTDNGVVWETAVGKTYTSRKEVYRRDIPFGHWFHVLVTQNESIGLMYIDGQLAVESKSLLDFSTLGSTRDLFIGSLYTESQAFQVAYPFHGLIDEVMVWNRALSASEVKQVYELTGGK